MSFTKSATLLGSALAGFMLAAVLSDRAVALVPESNALSYSGLLTRDGVPLSEPTVLRVSGFETETAGTPVCVSSADMVDVVAGHFKVSLEDCRRALATNRGLWIEVRVDGAPLGARVLTSAVPYALEAARAAEPSPGGPLQVQLADLEAAVAALRADNTSLQTKVDEIGARQAVVVEYHHTSFNLFQSLAGGGPLEPVEFNAVEMDTTPPSVTTGAAWHFTAPVAGTYSVSFSSIVIAFSTPDSTVGFSLCVAAVCSYIESATTLFGTTGGSGIAGGARLVRLAAGDQLSVQASANNTGGASLAERRISIHLVD